MQHALTDTSLTSSSADEPTDGVEATEHPGGSQEQSCGSEHSACQAQG